MPVCEVAKPFTGERETRMRDTLKMAWLAIRWMGFAPIAQATRYALTRDIIERRWRKDHTNVWTGWGEVIEITPTQRGAHVRLEAGELELLFLAPDFVRISWLPGRAPVPYALARPVNEWSLTPTRLTRKGDIWTLTSDRLQIDIDARGGLSFCDADGHLLRHALPPRRAGERVQDNTVLRPEEHLYGLGEKTTSADRRGHVYELWNLDPGGYEPGDDPIYLNIPVYIGLHEQGSYLVFYENTYRATFDLGHEDPKIARHTFAGGMLRYYFASGSPPHLLERYTELTGRPPLPPLWFLGYHQSRYSYYPQEKVRAIVETFERLDIPLDVVHLDIHYMHGYRVFTWDRERFPDPKSLSQTFREKGVRLVAIVDPGIKVDHKYPIYTDGLKKDVFCKLPNGALLHAPVWPGWCVFPDFTHPKTRTWWGQHYQRLLDVGIAGFWNDMNEPATFAAWGEPTFPLPTRHDLEGRGGDHREAHNVYGLQMARASYEGLCKLAPERRHVVVSRSGWAGLQRYAWNWTGDNQSDWASLALTIPMMIGLGLSGIGFTGPDVGGFMGAPTGELYTRWLQMAAFFPFFRTHTAFGTPDQEPWSFGQPYLDINRETIRFRYRLLPYLYTRAWEAFKYGWPPIRPVWWLEPDNKALWEVEDAFLVGNDLLVAPILVEGARRREVRLPRGHWYNYWTGDSYKGNQVVEVDAPLEYVPLFVRAGTVLPLSEPAPNTDKLSRDRIHLHVYPPFEGERMSKLYTDAGDGWEYIDGAYRVDEFRLARTEEHVYLEWMVSHEHVWPYREIHWHLIDRPAKVLYNEEELDVSQGRFVTYTPGGRMRW